MTAADSLEIKRLRQNANAVLDSLVRYEFLKTKTSLQKVEMDALRQERNGTVLEMYRRNQRIRQLDAANAQLKAELENRKQRYARANRERWTWRAVGVAMVVLLLKN